MAEQDAVRLVLATVLDADHVAAIVDDRAQLGCPLTVPEAETIARHCDTCVDPDAAAEALIVSRYRGCRVSRPQHQAVSSGPAATATVTIVRAEEPAAFEHAVRLARKPAARDAKAWAFDRSVADQARQLAGGAA